MDRHPDGIFFRVNRPLQPNFGDEHARRGQKFGAKLSCDRHFTLHDEIQMLVPVDLADNERPHGDEHLPSVGACAVFFMDWRVGVRKSAGWQRVRNCAVRDVLHHDALRIQDLLPKRDPIQRVGFNKLSHRATSIFDDHDAASTRTAAACAAAAVVAAVAARSVNVAVAAATKRRRTADAVHAEAAGRTATTATTA